MSPPPPPASKRPPLLARLRVGTKLMLLVLLPVGVLVGFMTITAVNDWDAASDLQVFQAETRQAFALANVASQLANERTAAVLLRLQPSPAHRARLAAAQRGVDQALRQARRQAARGTDEVNVAGRLSSASRQLSAFRPQAVAGSLTPAQISQGYGRIVSDLIGASGDLLEGAPTENSGEAADAYLAIVQAVEAAQRERADVASVLATPGHAEPLTAAQWPALEGAELGTFRRTAADGLPAEVEGVLFSPAGLAVQQVRDGLSSRTAVRPSLAAWLAVSGERIDRLIRLQHGAARSLAGIAAGDLVTAQRGGIRDAAVLLAVLVVVAALAMALRRSITGPLREVSAGARTLSSGDLEFDVSYSGRDEIGDVAAAFRDLRVTAGRLATEIRATTTAIGENRLDHRADVAAFDGTWAQLLAGLNETTAAFARLHSRRDRAERELAGIFNLSLDLLAIAGTDGYLKRVNPAFEEILGYTSEELLAKPYSAFVHPNDRAVTLAAQDVLASGKDVARFENRYLRKDGAECWLQWNARSVPEEGLIYAAGRNVTASRRAREEQAALRRVATLVARGVAPAKVFDAVVAEMRLILGAENTRLMRFEQGRYAVVLATSHEPGLEIPVGDRVTLDTENVAARVWRSGRPERMERFGEETGYMADIFTRLGIRLAAGAPIIVEGRLWGVILAAWRRTHPGPGAEERIAEFTALVVTALSNAQARADLAASRARIVAASDETRRRIERDLHDGTQQRLVSLGLQLRAAQDAVPPGNPALSGELAAVASGLVEVLAELRELSRGIHPAILTDGGLAPALKALARRSAVPVRIDLSVPGRLPERVEVAAYFIISEALANVAKHARASIVQVRAEVLDGTLELLIRDDGSGGADPSRGSGLIGLTDRVEALGGTIAISSPPGAGTQITVSLPTGDSWTGAAVRPSGEPK
jgi:PAS domain S-box-containing protein